MSECRTDGKTAKNKLRPGFKWAKGRKGCPVKAKGPTKQRKKSKVATQKQFVFKGAGRRRRRGKK